MERHPLFSLFLLLGKKLTIDEQSCTLQGHFSLTSCHVLTAKIILKLFTKLISILLCHYSFIPHPLWNEPNALSSSASSSSTTTITILPVSINLRGLRHLAHSYYHKVWPHSGNPKFVTHCTETLTNAAMETI